MGQHNLKILKSILILFMTVGKQYRIVFISVGKNKRVT